MQKTHKALAIILLFLITAVIMQTSALAAGIEFSVSPVFPENQRDEASGYFDLNVQPGQKQDLSVTVTNQSTEDIVVLVEAITASTNLNGIVNYTTPGPVDETLKHSFSDMTKVPEEFVTIPAQSDKQITVTVTIPDEPFDGIILGSIQVTKELTEEEKNSGATIINKYAYVIAVRLQENNTVIEPDFAMGGVTAELLDFRGSITANIRNLQPTLVKGVSVAAQIYSKGDSSPIMELSKDDVEFAPNSIFPFSLVDEAGYGIQAGSYLAKIELKHEGKDWSFEQEFEVKSEEAASINQKAVNQTQQRQTATNVALGMPLWALIAITAGGVILLLIIILLIMTMRRMQRMKVD